MEYSAPSGIKENPKETHKFFSKEEVNSHDGFENVFMDNQSSTYLDIKVETNKNNFKTCNDSHFLQQLIPVKETELSKDAFLTQLEPGVKIETMEVGNASEKIDMLIYNEWNMKSEELEIKMENRDEDESMLINSIDQDTREYQSVENDHQIEALKKQDVKMSLSSTKRKILECDQCHYQTIKRSLLNRHLLKHQDPKDITMYKCTQCDYQSRRKDHLKTHLLLHQSHEDVEMFKCNQCEYQSPNIRYLKRHHLRHKNCKDVDIFQCNQSLHQNPKNVVRYKCDRCDYQAPKKSQLENHLIRHKTSEEVYMFKCAQCDYQTRHKGSMQRHVLRHKTPENASMFKCDHCDYQAIYKSSLKKHELRHKNPEDVSIFKCDHCSYKTFYSSNLNTHVRRHKNTEDCPTRSCDFRTLKMKNLKDGDKLKSVNCSDEIPNGSNLKNHETDPEFSMQRHLLQHKIPEDVDVFRCEHCSYYTIYKSRLKRHVLQHQNPEDVNMFKCDQCSYKTIDSSNLNKHKRLKHKKTQKL